MSQEAKAYQRLLSQRNNTMFKIAFDFFCEELDLTPQERSMISVTEVKRLAKDTSGTCSGMYDSNNELTAVEINILSYASPMGMIDVLAHEMVHAKQHIRGEFYFQKVEHKLFGFIPVMILEKFHLGQRLLTTPYYERACEIEAHNKAYELTVKLGSILHASLENTKTDSKQTHDEDFILED